MATHVSPVKIRWSDLDLLGHVNNVRMLELVQEGRVQLLQGMSIFESRSDADHGGAASIGGISQVVARIEIDYKRPVFLTSEPVIEQTITEIRNRSYTLTFVIRDERGNVCAQGVTVLVLIDAATGASVPIPPEFRQGLERFTP